MNKIQIILNWGKDKIFVTLCTFMALYPASPWLLEYVSRDSGVFLFAGWRVLNGDIPYVDFWDHKPPMIFFINALGLWLLNGDRWGVWIIEFISLWIAAYISFRLLKNLFGTFAASITTFIWMYSFVFLIARGNFTTEYVLPFQMATLFLFYQSIGKPKNYKLFFIMGLFGGISFFTKQTTIGIWLAISIYLLVQIIRKHEISNSLKKILFMFGGGLVVTVIICGYFLINDAFFAFWDSAFRYNFIYSTLNETLLSTRLKNLFDFRFISKLGFVNFSFLGMFFYLILSLKKKLTISNSQHSIMLLMLIVFPLEILLINVTGSPYEHYYPTLLPVLALGTGFIFSLFDTNILHFENLSGFYKKITLAGTIILFALAGFADYHYKRIEILKIKVNEPLIHYLQENTQPEEEILVWGAETMVNFHTKRNSPTRYVYQYPLTKEGYTSEEKILEFLDDIIQNQPKYMIDSRSDTMPFFVFPIQSQRIEEKLNKIWSGYEEVDEINWWKVYQLSPGQPTE